MSGNLEFHLKTRDCYSALTSALPRSHFPLCITVVLHCLLNIQLEREKERKREREKERKREREKERKT